MLRDFVHTLKRIDDVLEILVFDWALHPHRRGRTLALLAGAGLLVGAGFMAPSTPELTPAEHFREGTRLLAYKARSRQAIRHLRAASKGMREDARVWQNLGHAFLNAKRHGRALRAYQRAVELDPSVQHLFFLGYAYVKQDLPEVALGCYDQILEGKPFFYPALAYQGVAHDKAGRYQQALRHFDRALAYNPAYVPALFHKGITYVNTEQYQESIRCFERVIELDPTESAAYYNIACCYSLMGNVEKGLEWLERSVSEGFRDFCHMDGDGDLDNLRQTDGYWRLRERAREAWEAEATL